MDERVYLFGIRHHGPGSAASLLAALDDLEPAAVLIELPADATPALEFAASAGMRPPIALLVHDAKEATRSTFLPFADFSPEWQALRFALGRAIPVEAIDLPAGVRFREAAEVEEAQSEETRSEEEPSEEEPSDDEQDVSVRTDPLDRLAHAAGHSDGEAWWDAIVERAPAGPGVFGAIGDAMAAARDAHEAEHPAEPHEIRREAHMRRAIQRALKAYEGPIAVVVGAWHVPALRSKAKGDRERLVGLKPRKAAATWVPWTEPRLAARSGYGAGVASPGWYGHLWREGRSGSVRDVTTTWMARAARVLRDEGAAAATSSAIDAARLATALASVRGHARVGLAEVQDAALAALCHGEVVPLRALTLRLVIGDAIGEVADDVPQMPLAEDLARIQRRLRLKPEALERQLALDLRTDSGLARSTLLHRLNLFGVDWGVLEDARAGRGTFREVWTLEWRPELSVRLAEGLRFGTTVESAAEGAARLRAEETGSLGELAELVEACLLADLGAAAEAIIARLQAAAASAGDVAASMEAAAPLASILRYGTARAMPTDALRGLIEALIAQVLAGLDYAARDLDEESAHELGVRVRRFSETIAVLEDDDTRERWLDVLEVVAAPDSDAARYVAGVATRRLIDEGRWADERAARAVARSLALGIDVAESGAWLDGFLGEQAQVLLHDRALLEHVDSWLVQLDGEEFEATLPILRRSFADFDPMERRRMMRELLSTAQGSRPAAAPLDGFEWPAAFERALPLIGTILGLDAEGRA